MTTTKKAPTWDNCWMVGGQTYTEKQLVDQGWRYKDFIDDATRVIVKPKLTDFEQLQKSTNFLLAQADAKNMEQHEQIVKLQIINVATKATNNSLHNEVQKAKDALVRIVKAYDMSTNPAPTTSLIGYAGLKAEIETARYL